MIMFPIAIGRFFLLFFLTEVERPMYKTSECEKIYVKIDAITSANKSNNRLKVIANK